MSVKRLSVKIAVASKRKARQPDAMTSEHNRRVLEWIEYHQKRLKLSGLELGRRVFDKENWLGNVKRKVGAKTVGLKEMSDLERFFGRKFGDTEDQEKTIAKINSNDRIVTFGEIITIGYKGDGMARGGQHSEIPASPVKRYADMPQEAWPIQGDLAEPLALDGAYALVVDHALARPYPQVGDEIVLRRYHPILFREGDTSQSECTIRVVTKDERGIVFKAPSENPLIKDVVYDPEDSTVVVEKLIIGYVSYKP